MTLECGVCFCSFDPVVRKPLIGTCGHSVCKVCLRSIGSKCPRCQCTSSFVCDVTNYQLIDLIENVAKLEENHKTKVSELNGALTVAWKARSDDIQTERKKMELLEKDTAKQLAMKEKCITDLNKKIEQEKRAKEQTNFDSARLLEQKTKTINDLKRELSNKENMLKESRWTCT